MSFARQPQGLSSIVLQGGQNVFGKAFYGFTLDGNTGRLEVTKVIDGTAVYTTDGNLKADSDYEAWAYTMNKLLFSFNSSGHLILEVR